MIDKLKKFLEANLDLLNIERDDFEGFYISKFAHNTRNDISKVIFFVSHKQTPIAVVKVLRNKKYNQFLDQEKKDQEKNISRIFISPNVYFDGEVDGFYFFVEEYLNGRTVNRYSKKILDLVVEHQLTLEKKERMSTDELLNIFEFDINEKKYSDLLKIWRESLLKLSGSVNFSLQHGDIDYMNILFKDGKYYLIDWETVGDYFIWGLDLMHYLKRNIKYSSLEDFILRIKSITKLQRVNWSEAEIKFLFLTDNLIDYLRKNYFSEYRFKLAEYFESYESFSLYTKN